MQFVIDDSEFGTETRHFRTILSVIKWTCKVLGQEFRVDVIGDYKTGHVADPGLPGRLADLNATWQLRGEMVTEGRSELIAWTQQQISGAYGRISSYLDAHEPDVLFVPGGVFGTSGIWFSEAQRRSIRFASYDAGTAGVMIVAGNGIACHLADIPGAYAAICKEVDAEPAMKARILEIARSEIARRQAGTDMFQYQIADGTVTVSGRSSIVLALNSSWDAAALGPHQVFPDSKAWIRHTVETVLRDTSLDVIIRQHPAERFSFGRTSDDYHGFIHHHFGVEPRIHFIAAADPVNSYELMADAAAIVTHTSTIGIEAVIAGCPVITGSRSYYSNMGFVTAADTIEAYDRAIAAAAAGMLLVEASQREAALIAYYSSQCCNWVKTEFNPAEFRKWWGRHLADIGADPVVDDVLRCFAEGVPYSVIQHHGQMQHLQ
ncbi:hypothetical protein GV829_10215 [Sphingomonas lacunae]|uniref:Capsule biosynthesis protein n=1 Tax=Sphingomonas lacunae TaxID=2698828 RepID=A0A6M4AWM6_9SPHN|nr:hypothetical protein [Sphingomonas lacunae]QJQ32770.1 hypothetical protein GV829_10215 [Sphingomonas lacunae]